VLLPLLAAALRAAAELLCAADFVRRVVADRALWVWP